MNKLLSSNKQLQSRGFVEYGKEVIYKDLNKHKLIQLLSSNISTDRTTAARLIKGYIDNETVLVLCSALQKETKLYTKIEICNSLTHLGLISIAPLTQLLGKIGDNQHKKVDLKPFKKNSYPLPRDIAARTIIRFKSEAIPFVDKYIADYNSIATPEAIDVIGYVCFYNNNSYNHTKLINIINSNKDNDLIVWKTIRALSSFNDSLPFLKQQLHCIKNRYIIEEIKRSIRLITNRVVK